MNAIDECNGMVQVEIEIGYQTVLRDVGCTPNIGKETTQRKEAKKKRKSARDSITRCPATDVDEDGETCASSCVGLPALRRASSHDA